MFAVKGFDVLHVQCYSKINLYKFELESDATQVGDLYTGRAVCDDSK